jgi:dTDP-4-dehydrorhamnose 3,5-epimerase
MLSGISVHNLKKLPDERGFFCELLRADWQELLRQDTIVQASLSMSYPNVVRAWHRHSRGQIDYLIVLRGAIRICAYDDRKGSVTRGYLDEIIARAERPQVIRIPGFYWHGTKTIGNEPSLNLYFVTKLYDYANPDEERRPWNDPTVMPIAINGKKDDPRVGKPWDWFYPYR